jgi:DNA-binding Xre family transcriptional regulator
MLTLNLAPIFKTRGIERPHAFLVKAGIHSSTASKIFSSGTRVFRLDHIELLCRILVCEPNDLLSWTPGRGQTYPPSHPLQNLHHDEAIKNWQETLANMPFKQLKQFTKKIIQKTEEDGA